MAQRALPTGGRARLVETAKGFDWRQYIIYVAFALVFLYFAINVTQRMH